MIIEVIVALLLFVAFTWLAGKISSGAAPKGKRWNLLESFLTFIRNDVVLPGMGEHDTDRSCRSSGRSLCSSWVAT